MQYGDVLSLIKSAHILAHNNAEKDFKEIGLTASQGQVLSFLLNNVDKTINQKDIEKALLLTNPTVSGILNRLEQKGFIEKVITPHDNRYKIIKLTPSSIAMKQVMIQKLKQAEQFILKDFTSEEKEQLALFLSRIVQNMSKD